MPKNALAFFKSKESKVSFFDCYCCARINNMPGTNETMLNVNIKKNPENGSKFESNLLQEYSNNQSIELLSVSNTI